MPPQLHNSLRQYGELALIAVALMGVGISVVQSTVVTPRLVEERVHELRGTTDDHEGRLRIQEQRVDAGMATLQTQVQTTISRLDRIETKIDALVR